MAGPILSLAPLANAGNVRGFGEKLTGPVSFLAKEGLRLQGGPVAPSETWAAASDFGSQEPGGSAHGPALIARRQGPLLTVGWTNRALALLVSLTRLSTLLLYLLTLLVELCLPTLLPFLPALLRCLPALGFSLVYPLAPLFYPPALLFYHPTSPLIFTLPTGC